jgi:hypothetical protein
LGDPQALKDELQKISIETEEGMSLLEQMTTDGIPKMFEKARDQYQDASQAAGETTGDDDIIVLTQHEVQLMQSRLWKMT